MGKKEEYPKQIINNNIIKSLKNQNQKIINQMINQPKK